MRRSAAAGNNSAAAVSLLMTVGRFDTRDSIDMLNKAVSAATLRGHRDCITAIMTAPVLKQTGMEQARRVSDTLLVHCVKDMATLDENLKHITDLPAALRSRVDEAEWSVLHSAVRMKRPVQVICRLLKLGADPLAKDAAGQTPAEYARAEGQTLIAQLLDRAAQDTQAQS